MARTTTPVRRSSSGTAIILLVFAALDLVLALAMLVAGGFSWQFGAIALIGVGLAFYGLKLVYFGAR